MRTAKRRTYKQSDIINMVTNDLEYLNMSPRIAKLVIESYIACKRQALLEGGYVQEPGISTAELLIRRVSERFSKKRYTVKVKESIDNDFQKIIMDKLDNDEDFQDIMDFNPSKDINKEE